MTVEGVVRPVTPVVQATGAERQPAAKGPAPSAPPVAAVPPRAVQPVRPGSEADRPRLDLARMLQEAAEARHAGREVRVRFARDETAERLVVRVEDPRSGELLAQYPPEELLRFYAAVRAERDRGAGLVDLAT